MFFTNENLFIFEKILVPTLSKSLTYIIERQLLINYNYRAVGSLVQWIESEKELAVFRELLPLICESIGFCIMNDYEEEAMHSFEIFDDLIEMVF